MTARTMLETAAITRNVSSPIGQGAGTREESFHRSLAQCAHRRFQTYSQLPVRCHKVSPYYRPPRPFRLPVIRTPVVNTAKSCPDSLPCHSTMFRSIGSTPRCKKSLSMIDLSPGLDLENDLRSESSTTLERLDESGKEITGNDGRLWTEGFLMSNSDEEGFQFTQDPRKAGSIISRVLMLNAWRRRRLEVTDLRETIDTLNQQVEQLHLQIMVLRRLLDTEYNRVGVLTGEVHRVKTQLDEAQRERDSLKTEKERLEEELNRFTELSEERSVVAENLRNQLQTAQDQVQALDQQISRDREKLLKLREDKRILLDKVSASEALAKERAGRAEKAESAAEDLQLKLATQIALVESSQEKIHQYAKELKAKEEQRSKLERRLRSAEENGRSLNMRIVYLEGEMSDREAALRRIESAYKLQTLELNDLRDRLIRQSQEGGWSNRMLQIAGQVVRAPRAILRTLSLFSSASPFLTP